VHRITQEIPRRAPVFGYGPFTLYGAAFQKLHLTFALPHRAPTTPAVNCWFGLFRFRSPLLTESLSLSFPPVTEMFHFTGCRDVPAMYSQELEQVLPHSGYPIRKSPGHSVFTALRGLSQLATSFIAYWHQGIHYALFVA
jgi:hypothetical protein